MKTREHNQCPYKLCNKVVNLSNRVCCFQTLDAVIPKDLISDYLEITTTVVVPCAGTKSLLVHRYSVVTFTICGPVGL